MVMKKHSTRFAAPLMLLACVLGLPSMAAGQTSEPPEDYGITDEQMGLAPWQVEESRAELDKMNAPAIAKADFPDTAAKCGASAGFLARVGKERNDEALRTEMTGHADFWWQYLMRRVGQDAAQPLVAQARTWIQTTGRNDGLTLLIGQSNNMMTFCKSYERIIRKQSGN